MYAIRSYYGNLFRNDPRAFAADPLALETAREAIARGIDKPLLPVERQFVYLPFEHSEAIEDQRYCCELMATLTEFQETADLLDWALKHLKVIERFGRFPRITSYNVCYTKLLRTHRCPRSPAM